MKAIVYTEYGPPDVLQLKEVEKLAPKDDEVLVKVQAASVNPGDWHALRGTPFLQRLESGFPKPKNTILGADVAGFVEAVGENVTQFQPGDEIYADLYWCGFGAFAEYICIPEHAVALKPANISFEEAAAVPQAAFTALHALRDQGQVQPGQKVLINGASGGVGTFAVQLAKSFGADVTGVCSTRNLEMVRSLGADQVIDYTEADFTQNGRCYDLIVDLVANRSLSDLKRALSPEGICVVVGFSTLARMLQVRLLGPWISMTGSKKIGMLMPNENRTDLVVMKELLEAGKVAPVIDRRYSFSEIPEAIRYLEEGHVRGKVVITVKY
jgi:NADPH:quinone reductase-like Zn-dependent oxidoreductase